MRFLAVPWRLLLAGSLVGLAVVLHRRTRGPKDDALEPGDPDAGGAGGGVVVATEPVAPSAVDALRGTASIVSRFSNAALVIAETRISAKKAACEFSDRLFSESG